MAEIHQNTSGPSFSSLLAPFTSVATATVRPLNGISAIELATLREGDMVYTTNLRDYWKWLPLSSLVDNTTTEVTICTPTIVGAGLGRFERLLLSSPDWMTQTTWVIDEANSSTTASNENDGLTVATPLLTTIERRRRMGKQAQWLATTAYHIRYISAIATTSDIIEGQRQLSAVVYLHASMTDGAGDLLFSGVATTVDTLNSATSTPWAITSATIPVGWTTAGPAGSTLINFRCRLTSGANIKALAWVSLNQGGVAPAAKARLTEFLTPVASFAVAPFVVPASTRAGPSNGDTFVIEALRILTRIQIDLEGAPGNSNTGTGVVFDSIQCSIINNSSTCGWYADGSEINVAIGVPGFITAHNCKLITLSDSGAKTIIGGYTTTPSLFLKTSTNSNSTLNFYTIQGAQTVFFGATGPSVWVVSSNIGIFDTGSAGQAPIRVTSPSAIFFNTGIVYGTGNASCILEISNGCSVTQAVSGLFATWTVVTTKANQVVFGPSLYPGGPDPGRTTFPAFDRTTGLYTAERLLSFANIAADVALGGFANVLPGSATLRPLIQDPLSGAGINGI